ncbi:hypothetical protein B0T25DRAFT_562908 [Lasiosphaeria hispida]|uniref:Uncharacterized protein n=1 Tax=Lasiosphaeria hispida TaxID=260671 RepID=A0AAJ0MKU3_9PEZI|nr:hypothetical protein B0T25DRAFT_562908 [Lasiosphaeria hispida]
MTLSEKVEQSFTERPDSELFGLNMAMHYGQGAAAAVIRATMAWNGVRGPFADLMFVGIRLLIDQTLENWTGVGALPWTWPVQEQIIDILHKTVFAFTTGYLIDRWIK